MTKLKKEDVLLLIKRCKVEENYDDDIHWNAALDEVYENVLQM